MDRIFSTRVDESVVRQIGVLAQRLRKTKKAVIEDAVRLYAEKVERETNFDALEQTLGAWRRAESPDSIVEEAREAFRRSMCRYQE